MISNTFQQCLFHILSLANLFRSVPYYGQRPHAQGKPPHPLLCFSWNLRNAFRRAFPAQDGKKKKDEKSRIGCLMDHFNFDINQLLIYENQNRKNRKECVTQTLRIMKMKVDEVKQLAAGSKCLEKADAMLKRRDRLKCMSRSFRLGLVPHIDPGYCTYRRQLIEHMANYDPSERSSRLLCEIMKQLDGLDADVFNLCKGVKDKHEESFVDLVNDTLCPEEVQPEKKIPAICSEVLRPYDPTTDEDANSIHLRYIPALDSFKVDMARNPCALRLPLMCPPMKRIMNKMKPCYLMDDVPCKLDPGYSEDDSRDSRNLAVGFVQVKKDDFDVDFSFTCSSVSRNVGTNRLHSEKNINCIPNIWLLASQQLWQI